MHTPDPAVRDAGPPTLADGYDPFAPGPSAAGVRTVEVVDPVRGRSLPCEIWFPALSPRTGPVPTGEVRDATPQPGPHPLVVFSHYSGGNRRSSTFLCTHLAGHGYVVAALDHSEVVAPELQRPDGESDAARAARVDAIVASRVPDVRLLLDHMLGGATDASRERGARGLAGVALDHSRIALVGHSFGGWTALAVPEADARVGAVVALAPGGSRNPLPGVLRLTLTFDWGRDIPTLYLAAEHDVPIPPDAVEELFRRTPGTARMVVLRRADHQHFVDDVEGDHEAVRAMAFPGEAAWMPGAMRPISELSSGAQAHLFVRGLTVAHLDAALRGSTAAERFLDGDVEAALAARGVEAFARRR